MKAQIITKKPITRKLALMIAAISAAVILIILLILLVGSESKAEKEKTLQKNPAEINLMEFDKEETAVVNDKIYNELLTYINGNLEEIKTAGADKKYLDEASVEQLINKHLVSMKDGLSLDERQKQDLISQISSQLQMEISNQLVEMLLAQKSELESKIEGMSQGGGAAAIVEGEKIDLTSFIRVDRWDEATGALYITSMSTEEEKHKDDEGESDTEQEDDIQVAAFNEEAPEADVETPNEVPSPLPDIVQEGNGEGISINEGEEQIQQAGEADSPGDVGAGGDQS